MSIQSLSKFFKIPLTRWIPEDLPLAEHKELTIDCKEKVAQEILFEAIQFSYDVLTDDQRLRASLKTFEAQRGNYPVRREFDAYTIHLQNGNADIQKRLTGLGFKLK